MYAKKGYSAWTDDWSGIWPSTASIMALGGREWDVFEFLRGLVICSSYQVKLSTCVKSYRHLWVYTEKECSAWIKVSTGTCPSTGPIMAPGGRNLGHF